MTNWNIEPEVRLFFEERLREDRHLYTKKIEDMEKAISSRLTRIERYIEVDEATETQRKELAKDRNELSKAMKQQRFWVAGAAITVIGTIVIPLITP